MIERVTILREPTSPLGTFGILRAPRGFECYTLERPWAGNVEDVSCVPLGIYLARWRKDSPKHGEVYELQDVPGRANIQLHPANWFDELLGCIALGRAIMDVKRKDGSMMKGVTSSKDACAAFADHMDRKPFMLTIKMPKEGQ